MTELRVGEEWESYLAEQDELVRESLKSADLG